MGNPLAVFRQLNAPDMVTGNFGDLVSANELAVSEARTGAFFSNDQAPLSSRTVRSISGVNFPLGIRNRANGALYGIENTNRGCSLNTAFNAGKAIQPAQSINGLPCNPFIRLGCSLGIATGKSDLVDTDPAAVNPGGIPVFKNGILVGGIGVTGVPSAVAEFAALIASVTAAPGFGPVAPDPGVVILDGIQLPFVEQTSQPPGTSPGQPSGTYVLGPSASPLGGGGVPDGWLIGPVAGSRLTAAQVSQIVSQAISQAQRTRAAIRLPLGSTTAMVISVADLDGSLLGVFRMPDATVFSIDVATAKSRNVVYFSSPARVPSDMAGVPPGIAVTNRTISFGAQPFYPPGINGSGQGPFFNVYVLDTAVVCSQASQPPNRNQSGIVFFPGSTPLYLNGEMVGGLGVSGDGVEQDDLVTAAGATNFAPAVQIRADQIFVEGLRLPYFKFPRNPEDL
ncbi:MAG: heme-binding protein, partial [Candidatus Rokuibacteriota bacterium]